MEKKALEWNVKMDVSIILMVVIVSMQISIINSEHELIIKTYTLFWCCRGVNYQLFLKLVLRNMFLIGSCTFLI